MTRRLNKFQAALVIARRDYTATVLSRTFVFFLIGPLFPLLIALLFAGIGARVAQDDGRPRVAVIATPTEFVRLREARDELDDLSGIGRLPELVAAPRGASADALLASREQPVVAVLSDPFGAPTITGSIDRNNALAGQAVLIVSRATTDRRPLPGIVIKRVTATAGSVEAVRSTTARAGQAVLFFLTLLLSGMLLSQFIEEKSNKVIEVLAAAVPVETVFLGKLFAMLSVSLTGIAVWSATGLAAAAALVDPAKLATVPEPAVGWPVFALLGCAYFAMSYLLIGAAFLGIGAQAGTAREVQTLSMPVTMAQVALFALANVAISGPHGPLGITAAAFPLSSPFAMMARAALDPAILPHLAALAWQALWVAIILKFAAAWFRRSVLSGKAGKRRWFGRGRVRA